MRVQRARMSQSSTIYNEWRAWLVQHVTPLCNENKNKRYSMNATMLSEVNIYSMESFRQRQRDLNRSRFSNEPWRRSASVQINKNSLTRVEGQRRDNGICMRSCVQLKWFSHGRKSSVVRRVKHPIMLLSCHISKHLNGKHKRYQRPIVSLFLQIQ